MAIHCPPNNDVHADMSFSLRADPQEAVAHWELS